MLIASQMLEGKDQNELRRVGENHGRSFDGDITSHLFGRTFHILSSLTIVILLPKYNSRVECIVAVPQLWCLLMSWNLGGAIFA